MIYDFTGEHEATIEFYRRHPGSSKYACKKANGNMWGDAIDDLAYAGILKNLGFEKTNKTRPGYRFVVERWDC